MKLHKKMFKNQLDVYLVDENNEIIMRDNIQAHISFYNKDRRSIDEYTFDEIYLESLRQSSGTTREKECLLFGEIFSANYEEINHNIRSERNERLAAEIKRLTEEMNTETAVENISDTMWWELNRITLRLNDDVVYLKHNQKQYVENSAMWQSNLNTIQIKNDQIASYLRVMKVLMDTQED